MNDVEQAPRGAQRTRLQILEGALACFQEHGYEGTAVDTVAHYAGVAKSTLYAHFASKDELFQALLGERVRRYAAFEVAPLGEDFESALVETMRRFVDASFDRMSSAFFRLVVGEAARYPAFASLFYEAGPRRARDRIASLLALGGRTAGYRFPDPPFAAEQLIGMMLGHAHLRIVLGQPPEPFDRDLAGRATAVVHAFLRGYEGAP